MKESGNNQEQRPDTVTPPPLPQVMIPLKLPAKDVLWGLFFFPHLVLPMLVFSGQWARAWRLFTGVFIFVAIVLSSACAQHGKD